MIFEVLISYSRWEETLCLYLATNCRWDLKDNTPSLNVLLFSLLWLHQKIVPTIVGKATTYPGSSNHRGHCHFMILRYSGYDPRAVGKRECKNSSILCHPSPQCGKIMIPRYLMDLTLPFLILYPEFVYLLWLWRYDSKCINKFD